MITPSDPRHTLAGLWRRRGPSPPLTPDRAPHERQPHGLHTLRAALGHHRPLGGPSYAD